MHINTHISNAPVPTRAQPIYKPLPKAKIAQATLEPSVKKPRGNGASRGPIPYRPLEIPMDKLQGKRPAAAAVDAIQSTEPAAAAPSAPPVPDRVSAPTDSVADPTQQYMSMKGLVDAWGQSDSPYDLNNDGTVNVDDLLMFIANYQQHINTPLPAPSNAPDTNADAAEPVVSALTPGTVPAGNVVPDNVLTPETPVAGADEAAGTVTLADIVANWGRRESEFDLNGDGVVNVDDLLQFIASMSYSNGAPTESSQDAPLSARLTNANQPTGSVRNIASLTNVLLERLEKAGFDKHPPSNIHDLVDRFEFLPHQKGAMLKLLAAKYPEGLGINRIG